MKPLLPGQAAIVRHGGKVCIVVCDYSQRLILGDGSFDLRAEAHEVTVQGVAVVVVWFLFTLRSGDKVQEYHGYVNELEEHVLESLGTMNELTIIFAGHDGSQLGEASCPNTLKGLAHKFLGDVSRLAAIARWKPAHFAGAVAYLAAHEGE